jgi:hypothetical protein
MRVRRVQVENYRGIKSLDWRIPADKKFVCLIGPGDSCKSTILDAIHLALGERWSLPVSDTDFFAADVASAIVIRVALADLPNEIRSHAQLGLHLSGINDDSDWEHDPVDGYEPCVIVQLMIDKDMEPVWSAYRPGGTEPFATIGSGTRRRFAVFKVDERIDNHLRWTRTSALTRLTDASHGASGTLATALRAAQGAVAEAITPEMQSLTDDVGRRLGSVGSGEFTELKPGLDTSLSSSGGTLALFEGDVPLTNFGLGTRRLAGIATQEMAMANKSVILIDEVEYGLEPHRLVHLLKHLRSDAKHAQVFVTTHSAVAIEQLDSSDLAVIRTSNGDVGGTPVPTDMKFAQSTLRGGPSAFLAKRIIVTEGKTEFGLLLGMIDVWDERAATGGTPSSAARGVAITDGEGSKAPNRARVLAELGYDVALFVDNDNRDSDRAVADAKAAGVRVFTWQFGNATEDEIVGSLDALALKDLLGVASVVRANASTVKSDLLNVSLSGPRIPGVDIETWIASGDFTLGTARSLVAKAALKAKWFKSVEPGRLLSEYVITHFESLMPTPFGVILLELKAYIYPPAEVPTESESSAAFEEQ